MGIKHQDRHPTDQSLPQHMIDSELNAPLRVEIRRLPLPDAEVAALGTRRPRRVLLVDDNPLIRKFISHHLVAAGYVVREAFDGLDAIAKLRTGPIDIIISDLTMPRMTGIEFLKVVRKRFPKIPVIVISGVAADDLPEEVAPEAYCQKNELISRQLLQTMSHLTRKSPLRPAPPPIDNEPAQARWDENGHYIIHCQDCLREFSVPRVFHTGRGEKRTLCVHCGKVVQFLVAEQSESK
jgi:CheY-like chemotaxis protein